MRLRDLHDNTFLGDMTAPRQRPLRRMDNRRLESVYGAYFRQLADIVGDTVLEQYVGSDSDLLPAYPTATMPIDFDRGPDGDDRMEAIHFLVCALKVISLEMQRRVARKPNLMKDRVLEMARRGDSRPADHTLLGRALRELTTNPEPAEYSPADLTNCDIDEKDEAEITFHCDLVVDYATDGQQFDLIAKSVLMVYQRENNSYLYREFRVTGDGARFTLQQHLASQDLTDHLGTSAIRRTKFRYTGNVATSLLKMAELDARFMFDAENSITVPVVEARRNSGAAVPDAVCIRPSRRCPYRERGCASQERPSLSGRGVAAHESGSQKRQRRSS